MKLLYRILFLVLFIPTFVNCQNFIDSNQIYKIHYLFEKVYDENDFELFKKRRLESSNSNYDSLKVYNHISKIKLVQNERLLADTSQYCKIIYSGSPIDFIIKIGHDFLEFKKSDFDRIEKIDCYSSYQYQCCVQTLSRTEEKVWMRFESEVINFDCQINLSYSSVIVTNFSDFEFSNIKTIENPNGRLPILYETFIIHPDIIEISHKWSN